MSTKVEKTQVDEPVTISGIIMRSDWNALQEKTGKNMKESLAIAVKAYIGGK